MSETQGKPPRSTDDIRTRLEAMHKSAEVSNNAGPYAMLGRNPEDQILVGEFFNRELAARFQSELMENGIFSKSTARGRKKAVTVDYSESGKASLYYQDFCHRWPDKRPKDDHRRFDGLIFGTVIGLALAMVFLVGATNVFKGLTFVIACSVMGALLGHLVDLARVHKSKSESFRFGLWEFLIILSIPSTAIVILQNLPKLLM